jgi:hypothetical protein
VLLAHNLDDPQAPDRSAIFVLVPTSRRLDDIQSLARSLSTPTVLVDDDPPSR